MVTSIFHHTLDSKCTLAIERFVVLGEKITPTHGSKCATRGHPARAEFSLEQKKCFLISDQDSSSSELKLITRHDGHSHAVFAFSFYLSIRRSFFVKEVVQSLTNVIAAEWLAF